MPDQNIRQKIADSKLFSGLSAEALDFLAEHAEHRHLGEGKVLFHQGDRATQFFLMLDGHLSLEIPAIEGPVLELQDIGPGRVAGWSWLIPPNRWHFQARARTEIDYLEFDGEAILAHCEAEPKFGYELVRRFSALMSERLDFARQKMMAEWKPIGFA
ncbi:MAG: cyclic nucleotide-binding domain-containing protein [Gammaproteobacteria bacterium]|jgi:CRP-like cAMP-binding protein